MTKTLIKWTQSVIDCLRSLLTQVALARKISHALRPIVKNWLLIKVRNNLFYTFQHLYHIITHCSRTITNVYFIVTASLSTIAVQIHKLNSDKADISNADTSIASIETSDNPRVTKEKTKRNVTTVSVDEAGTNTPSKVIDKSVITANNENKDDITAGVEAQVTGQEVTARPIADGDENNVQSIGAVVTEAAVSTGSSSSNRKWRHITADCLACVRTRPPSSHELREAFFAGKKKKTV